MTRARGVRRLALLGLAGLPAAVADLTCCGIDFTGSDLSPTYTSTFAACIDTCDATPGCIDISYSGEACYLKNKIETPLERDWVWTAKQISPATAGAGTTPKLSCLDKKSDKATYTTSTGAVFQVECGIDYAGGGHGRHQHCDLEGAQDRDWVWTAKLVPAGNSNGGGQSSTKLSCDGNASDGKIYKATIDNFEITCGKDYAEGDLLGLSTASFEACIEACDSHSECVNVAFIHGACYLKKEQNLLEQLIFGPLQW
ncbi:hypothetical protein C8A05DRAFT_34784, partial [Staphylotrichum tortipilum]